MCIRWCKMSITETRYPSVEKAWLKYCDTEFDETDIPEASIYQFFKEKTLGKEN